MTRVALRGIRSHLGRFLLSILAVLLGVAFVAGTFSLRSMMSATFDDIVESGTNADTYVKGQDIVTGEEAAVAGFGAAEKFPISLAETIAQAPGVAGAAPDIEGPIVLVGADGTAVMSSGPPSFGIALHPDQRGLSIADGREPTGPAEIALETAALERSGLAIGDTTTVVLAGEIRPVEVVGELTFAAPMAGAIMVGLDVDTATAAYAPDGMVSIIGVYGQDGVSQTELARSVEAAISGLAGADAAEVVTGDQMRTETRELWSSMLGFISTFLLVFAGIALFVGTFIISNTFAMVVRQRQREFAMLRAVGASPSQVFGSVLGQAAVIGVVGSLLGIGAGVGLVAGLRQVFAGMGMEMSGRIPLDGFTIAVSVVIGTLVSLVAAVVPARRAALTAPVEAMRDDVVSHDRASKWRTAVGAVLLAGGVAAVATATAGWVEDGGPLLGMGAAAVVVSVLMLAPTIVPGALGVLAAPVVHGMRPLGGLARGNVTRHPKRTASTAGALMIGMALVGAASVMAASTQASVRDVVDNESQADLLLQSATWNVPAQIVPDVAALDGAGRVDALKVEYTTVVDGEATPIIGVPPGFFDAVLTVPVVEGTTDALANGQAIVQLGTAEEYDWSVGEVISVSGRGGSVDVVIGAIIDSGAVGLPVVLADAQYDVVADPTTSVIDTVFVLASSGADVEVLRADIAELAAPYVVVSVMDGEEFGDALAAQVNQVLVILYALLGLSIVIAVLGIVNTLALSISERTREIGLLRAVGLGRLQLASVVTIESVLTAVFGTVLGLGVGAGLAATMPTVFADEGFTTLVVPWAPLGVLLALAVVVGAMAAVWPAVRASRMDVLEAIAYE
jgi:putative ABC transport system permease protein